MSVRVAAYCRVSTDKADQINSFIGQKAFFTDFVSRHNDWSFAGVYADEGITGTSTSSRAGFLRMIDDALGGQFDLIVTKEVSRFSRNILDAIAYTRRLKAVGVGVLFLNDGIDTRDSDSELRLGIMASVAQEESRKTSERVRWGQRRRMEQGVVFGPSLYGYDVTDGHLTIEPDGAETVRLIYSLYLDDRLGTRAIARELVERGIPTKSGGDWSPATVLKILKNEKYAGDLVQRKTVTVDYLTHRKQPNTSTTDRICIRDHHEPIITRERWDAVQAQLQRRAIQSGDSHTHGSRYLLSGRVCCAVCGGVFYCRTRRRHGNASYRVWTATCGCERIPAYLRECWLADVVRAAVGASDTRDAADELSAMMREAGTQRSAASPALARIQRRLGRLFEAYLSGVITLAQYRFYKGQAEQNLARLNGADTDKSTVNISQIDATIDRLASAKDPSDDFYLRLVDRLDILSHGITVRFIGHDGLWTVETA